MNTGIEGNRATDNRATDNRATDNRATDNRATDNRATDNRASDNFRTAGLESAPAVGMKDIPEYKYYTIPGQSFIIYFDLNKYELQCSETRKTQENYLKLKRLATLLKDKYTEAHLVGHASTEGETAYNVNLSKQRVNSVIKYLVKQGVAIDQLSDEAVGEKDPAVKEEGQEGSIELEKNRELNRRVEIEFFTRLPTGSLGKWEKFVENALTKHREGIKKLTRQKKNYEKVADELKTKGTNGSAYADLLHLEVDERAWKLERLKKNLKALEKAIISGPTEIKEWDRQRRIEDKVHLYNLLRLEKTKKRLDEAKQELKIASSELKKFWQDVVNYFSEKIMEIEKALGK